MCYTSWGLLPALGVQRDVLTSKSCLARFYKARHGRLVWADTICRTHSNRGFCTMGMQVLMVYTNESLNKESIRAMDPRGVAL